MMFRTYLCAFMLALSCPGWVFAQSRSLVPVPQNPYAEPNSAWRSLNPMDRDDSPMRFETDEGHYPLPPPARNTQSLPSSRNDSNIQNSSFGYQEPLLPSNSFEEVQGREVRGRTISQDQDQIQGDTEAYSETSGRVEVVVQRYDDGKPQIKRHVILDIDGNYVNHGIWQLYNRRGQILAEGNFDQGMMEGGWQRWHPSGEGGMFSSSPFNEFAAPYLSQARFHEGELDGEWEISDQHRRTIFKMPYKDGKREGTVVWFRPNGTKLREMNFKDGIPHGPLKEWDAQNKLTRDDEFIEGQRVVRETTFWRPKQKKTEDMYLDARLEIGGKDNWWTAQTANYQTVGEKIRHGSSEAWYDNGQPKMRVNYRDGVHDGRYTFWHRNGQKQISGVFENGKKQGRWIWWHENGIKAIEASFEDDIAVGEVVRWNPNGTVQVEPIEAIENRSELNEGELQPPIFGEGDDTESIEEIFNDGF